MMKRGWIVTFVVLVFNLFLMMQASAEVTTSVSGELRLRPEYRDNADFNDAADDTQSFYGQRIRLGVNARINPDLSGFIQLQDTRVWGDDAILTDTVTSTNQLVDIHQVYATASHIKGLPLSLKVGRQELNYGDQRLVGSFGWSNNGRAFDAIKLMYSHEIVDIDLWISKVDENNSCGGGVGCPASAIPASSGQDTDFYGVYSTFKTNLIPDSNLQAYLLYKYDGPTNLSEYTAGAKLAGKVSGIGIDYSGEFAYQFGDNGSSTVGGQTGTGACGSAGVTCSVATTSSQVDISAYAIAVEVGYMIPNITWSPRVAVEYDYATGSDSGDEDNTFDNLYPTNHLFYGYIDYQGWMNMSDIILKASATPSDKSYFYLAYHIFSLAEKEDAWYGANGLPRAGFGASTANTEDEVGQEIDLVARYAFNQNLKLEVGVSRFFAGDLIKNNASTAEDEDSNWAYLMGTVSF